MQHFVVVVVVDGDNAKINFDLPMSGKSILELFLRLNGITFDYFCFPLCC